ncbi:hypothetical protein N7492_009559 [Penicillium capsulatum]|uniref:Major facilitator superfamily (MFS) profile domain-containing protein n=1 Tax=Penicillium capsulatum TaxID=69766 RepID=A0A9W9HVJ4_9EURO|nr:hypothetical protein N7492_009559 [Penicillium capsulatum]KAJ6106947.1 hypothetical protein N7512_010464 [Penicillium capsulatum]
MCEGKTRGRLISSEVLFTAVDIVIAYWFDFGMSFVGGPIAWRLPIAMQIVFALFVIALVFGLPESPRWLMNHGQEQEALEVLCAVYDREPHDEYIVNERRGIMSAIEMENSASKQSFWKIFRNDEKNVGMNDQLSQILAGCVEIMFILGSLLPAFKLDHMGRRRTMMIGSLGLGICMMMVAALLSQVHEPNGKSYASASVAFSFLFMLIHGMSINSVPWVYVPEILPLEARTKGTAIGASSNWLWNFVVAMITPVIINRIQWKVYLIFMITNFVFIPVVYFFYPETGNLRLKDVDLIFFRGGDPVKQDGGGNQSSRGHPSR